MSFLVSQDTCEIEKTPDAEYHALSLVMTNPKNILIVVAEDDPLFRQLLNRTLQRLGFTVTTCEDGQKALDEFNSEDHVDLVITDLMMPNLDGAGLAKSILSQKPNQKFLFISGFNDAKIRDEAWYRPEFKFLQKPFDLHDLNIAVSELIA